MELIKPSEISGRILSLLDESNSKIIIVSPYMKISKWYKLINKLNALNSRGVTPELYVRDDPENTGTYQDLEHLGLPYKKIANLHSKLYLNERHGIVTSMNLLLSSEINSLEIGFITESWKEYHDLELYVEKYIHLGKPVFSDSTDSRLLSEQNKFLQSFKKELAKKPMNAWPMLEENTLHISTGKNNYCVSIYNGHLRITASLGLRSNMKYESIRQPSAIAKKISDLCAMKTEAYSNPKSDVVRISGQSYRKFNSESVRDPIKSEISDMVEYVIKFMDITENLQNPF